MILYRIHESQKAARPSAIFKSAGYANTADRLPLLSIMVSNMSLAFRTFNIRCAVGLGMAEELIKSELLNMGRSNIQSRA